MTRRRLLVGLIAAVGLTLFGWLLVTTFPRPVAYKVTRFLPETRTKTYLVQVPYVEDGQLRYRSEEREADYTVYKPVHEELEASVSPIQILQWVFLGLFILIFGLLAFTFCGLWFRDKLRQSTSSPHTRENKQNLGLLVAFVFGAAGSLFGVILDASPDVEKLEMKEELKAIRDLLAHPPHAASAPWSENFGPTPPVDENAPEFEPRPPADKMIPAPNPTPIDGPLPE